MMLNQENNGMNVEKVIEQETQSNENELLKFYNTKEVAQMLYCSIPTAREIMRRDDFPLLIVGGKWLVLKTALEQWATQKRM